MEWLIRSAQQLEQRSLAGNPQYQPSFPSDHISVVLLVNHFLAVEPHGSELRAHLIYHLVEAADVDVDIAVGSHGFAQVLLDAAGAPFPVRRGAGKCGPEPEVGVLAGERFELAAIEQAFSWRTPNSSVICCDGC